MFGKTHRNTPVQKTFFNSVAPPYNFIKKESPVKGFPVNFLKFIRIAFL